MLILLALAQLGYGQLDPDFVGYQIVSRDRDTLPHDLGTMWTTHSEPPKGLKADSEYWNWNDGWPAQDFDLVPTGDVQSDPSADHTANRPFPRRAGTQLPTSLGDHDEMYAVSVCEGRVRTCTSVGYLWVEDAGATLNWYLRADWPGDWYVLGLDQTAHFDHLEAVPSTTDDFRHVSLDRD